MLEQRRRRSSRLLTVVALSAGMTLTPTDGSAEGGAGAGQHADRAALTKAREQFQQAMTLQTAGDWTGALALLREVAAVKPTSQVLFNIALCEEKLGQLVAALADYDLAASDARANKAADVAEEAGRNATLVRERTPRLTIARGAGADAASITLDGVDVAPGTLGAPTPVDPGGHVVEAKQSGHRPFRESFTLAERESRGVTVSLEHESPTAPAPAPSVPPPAAPATSHASGPGALPWIVGGVGAASLVASGVFFVLRAGAIDDLDGVCGSARDTCPAASRGSFDSGRTYTTLADVTLGIGIVGVGVGAVLLATRSGKSTRSHETVLVPAAPNALAGASVVGRF